MTGRMQSAYCILVGLMLQSTSSHKLPIRASPSLSVGHKVNETTLPTAPHEKHRWPSRSERRHLWYFAPRYLGRGWPMSVAGAANLPTSLPTLWVASGGDFKVGKVPFTIWAGLLHAPVAGPPLEPSASVHQGDRPSVLGDWRRRMGAVGCGAGAALSRASVGECGGYRTV